MGERQWLPHRIRFIDQTQLAEKRVEERSGSSNRIQRKTRARAHTGRREEKRKQRHLLALHSYLSALSDAHSATAARDKRTMESETEEATNEKISSALVCSMLIGTFKCHVDLHRRSRRRQQDEERYCCYRQRIDAKPQQSLLCKIYIYTHTHTYAHLYQLMNKRNLTVAVLCLCLSLSLLFSSQLKSIDSKVKICSDG